MIRDEFGDTLSGRIARMFFAAMVAGDGDPWEYAKHVLAIPEIAEALAAKLAVDHINETYAKSVEGAARSLPQLNSNA